MSLQLVIGNSGSGKTEYMFSRLTREAEQNPKKNYLVIVPEQFTLQTQKKLVELSGHGVIMNVDVLSFKRLAYRVFDDLGIRTVRVIEETGKNLILRKVAQELEGSLPVLGANMNRMGYVGEVKSLISELMQYKISSQELDRYLDGQELSRGLSAKLRDVSLLYHGFEDFLRELSGITAEELLGVLERHVPESELLRDAVIVFDEFTGFTPIQNHLLAAIMLQAREVIFSVTMDAEEDFWHSRGPQELFDLPKETIRILMKIAAEQQISVKAPIVLGKPEDCRFQNAPMLAFLEKNLFRNNGRVWRGGKTAEEAEADEGQSPGGQISLICYKDPREELVFTARQISRLVREQGLRYRQIGVVTGNVEGYADLVAEVFEKYHIPYFADTTKELLFHPFIELLRAILEVLERDFSYEAVFRFLRCGFAAIPEEELDLLENYVRASGIRGKSRWSRKWTRLPLQPGQREKTLSGEESERAAERLSLLEEMRKKIYGLFSPLEKAFSRKGATVREEMTALYGLIRELGVEEQLLRRAEELRSRGPEEALPGTGGESAPEETTGASEETAFGGDEISVAEETEAQRLALEYEQLYGIVMELLDKYVSILGEESLSLREFSEILDAGLDGAKVATIPPKYDCVTVGDIERTRQSHIRVLFFIGVNDGIIPKAQARGGLISQFERDMLRQRDLPLAPGAREETFIQRYYLYLNMTKPSDELYVSYTRLDMEGKAVRPSYLIGSLRRLFPALGVEEPGEWEEILDCSTPEAAGDFLVSLCGQVSRERAPKGAEQWFALARFLRDSGAERCRRMLEEVLDAAYACYEPEQISAVIAEKLYGKELRGSITRLERFAACAYAHFLQYGLRLSERRESGLALSDMGNLYHDALLRYSRMLELSEKDWFTVSDDQRRELTEKAMQEAVEDAAILGLTDSGAQQHMVERMGHIFEQTVWALTRQVRKGRFVPSFFELSFNEAEVSDQLVHELGERRRLKLTGRMDRIDTCEDEKGYYVKVIDYKSGGTGFDLLKIYQGTQLQLMVYMNVAMARARKEKGEHREAVPGGVFYYHIDDPVIENREGMSEEEVQQAFLEKLRPEGLVNADEEVYRLMDQDFEGRSSVIPVKLKKDGTPGAGSTVATTEEFQVISDFVSSKLRQTGKAILEGDIRVDPRQEGQFTSCSFCPYGAVCGMDLRLPGYGFRQDRKLSREEILERMRTETAMERHADGGEGT